MSFNVKVSGIPKNVKIGKLVPLFSNILSMKSSDFLIRMLPSNGPVKDVMLSLPSYSEAYTAQAKLENFVYTHNQDNFVLKATMKCSTQKYKPRAQNFYQHEGGYYRNRSRSPHYEDATSQLDMQIEILRKQRMILEEERKLLEEQKKLDALKMQSFNIDTTSAKRTYYEDVEMSGESSNLSEKKFEPRQLTFHQASGVLIRKMNMFIQKHSSLEERKALVTQLRSVIKQRLAAVVAADGRGIYQTNKVIMLYRSQYSHSEDEELVKQVLKDVKENYCTDDIKAVQAPAEGANAQNEPDGTETAKGDHIQEEKPTAKDTAFTGDTNVSENMNEASVKAESKFTEKRLFFHKSSGVLLRKMNTHIIKHSTPETRKLLVEYLRYSLKQRLAAVVAGEPIFQTHRIIKMYRSKHCPTEDEDLVKQLKQDIDDGRIPEEIMNKMNGKFVSASNVEKNSAIDDETPEYKIISGEEKGQPNKEDADVSENIDSGKNVKSNINDLVENVENQNKIDNTESTTGNDNETEDVKPNVQDNDTKKHEETDTTENSSFNKEENIENPNKIENTESTTGNDTETEDVKPNVQDNDTKTHEETDTTENSSYIKEENIENPNKIDNTESMTGNDITSDDKTEVLKLQDDDTKTHEETDSADNSTNGKENIVEVNRGIKRKNDDDECSSIKVAKTDDILVIASKDKEVDAS